jgi:hypothetical protein
MESSAIFNQVNIYGSQFYKFVVKSVSDHGDSKKNDNYHKYASQTSAAVLLHLLKDQSKILFTKNQ